MKIYRYFTIACSGEINVSLLSQKIQAAYPHVKTEPAPLIDQVEGVLLSGLSRGEVLPEENGSEIDFQLDAFLFSSGMIVFEVVFDVEDIHERLISGNLVSEKLEFHANGERHADPLLQHAWSFFFNTMEFASISQKMSAISILDENAQEEIHSTIEEFSMLDTYFLGSETFMMTQAYREPCSIVCDPNGNADLRDNETVTVKTDSVVRKGNLYLCCGNDEDFILLFRRLVYRRGLMRFCNSIAMRWIGTIRSEAKSIKKNLNEKNRVYWNKMKNKLETWDLNFLDFYTAVIRMLDQTGRISTDSINDIFADKFRDDYQSARAGLLQNLEHIKYALSNIATPGEVHDEQILQRETEKGNERILLLSFLAMSIPLLGAVLAPGISVTTKIIAALVLCLMPAIYFQIRKHHRYRDHRRLNRMYLNNIREGLLADLDEAQALLESIENDPERSRKLKDETIKLLSESLSITEKQLNDVERKLSRL